jgi:3-hydroxybutyrate dehydrogenase
MVHELEPTGNEGVFATGDSGDHRECFLLKGKVAVVTGSMHGAGLGIACRLAAGGVDLAINGLDDSSTAEILREDISNTYGIRVAFSPADVSKPHGSVALIDDVTRMLGRVDILINNAGTQHGTGTQEFPVEQWNATIARNLTAVFFTMRAALPQMLERHWGRIVNVASMYGPVATANRAACVASAHGVVGLTKFIASETAASGVTCNAICPDLSANVRRSPPAAAAAPRHFHLPETSAIPQYGKCPPGESRRDRLGDLARFLCSDAAACLNGVALPVDGGGLPG